MTFASAAAFSALTFASASAFACSKICTCMYIYIYERERERERENTVTHLGISLDLRFSCSLLFLSCLLLCQLFVPDYFAIDFQALLQPSLCFLDLPLRLKVDPQLELFPPLFGFLSPNLCFSQLRRDRTSLRQGTKTFRLVE